MPSLQQEGRSYKAVAAVALGSGPDHDKQDFAIGPSFEESAVQEACMSEEFGWRDGTVVGDRSMSLVPWACVDCLADQLG